MNSRLYLALSLLRKHGFRKMPLGGGSGEACKITLLSLSPKGATALGYGIRVKGTDNLHAYA